MTRVSRDFLPTILRRAAASSAILCAVACGEVAFGPVSRLLDIRGKVIAEATGSPIGGARVTLLAPSDTIVGFDSVVTLADGSGNYHIVYRLADRSDCPLVTLHATAAGYLTATVPADSIRCMDAAQIRTIRMQAEAAASRSPLPTPR